MKKDLPRWDVLLKELKNGNQLSKARKLNKLKLISECGDPNIFYISPIPGYNKTTYQVHIHPEQCNCQYYVRTKKPCSHILAVHLYKRLRVKFVEIRGVM
tara:strand:+ start:121 stop:420 length:300 start_codon:yes stop_codon:yes gene_type:complete